jgi:TonB family protein
MKRNLLIVLIMIFYVGLNAQNTESAKLLKADESGFINVDKVPVLKSVIKPEYPFSAKAEGLEGTVYLKLLIDEKGNVAKVKIEQGVRDLLDHSAVKAAKKAKFSPAMIKNKPVKGWVILPVKFKLEADSLSDKSAAANTGNTNQDEPGINDFISYDKMPEMVTAVNPDYPEAAKKNQIEGKVYVKLLVDKEGVPKKGVVIKSDNEIFNQAAVDAALKSRFTPALKDNKPMEVWIVLPYRFTLM